MRIMVIGSLRNASNEQKEAMRTYVKELQAQGHEVRFPPDDTPQNERGIIICGINRAHVEWAERVDVFYDPTSQGTHFDLGIAFMARKLVHVADNVPYGEGKSFPRMIDEWEAEGPDCGESYWQIMAIRQAFKNLGEAIDAYRQPIPLMSGKAGLKRRAEIISTLDDALLKAKKIIGEDSR